MTSYLDIFEAGKETSLGVGCCLRLELRHAACCVSAHTVYVYSLHHYRDLGNKNLVILKVAAVYNVHTTTKCCRHC
jgi:hypothetical protein